MFSYSIHTSNVNLDIFCPIHNLIKKENYLSFQILSVLHTSLIFILKSGLHICDIEISILIFHLFGKRLIKKKEKEKKGEGEEARARREEDRHRPSAGSLCCTATVAGYLYQISIVLWLSNIVL